MSRYMLQRGLTLAALGVALVAFAPRAHAQPTGTAFGLGAAKIPDPGKSADRTQGLRFGHSVFHAGLALELGWDSNATYASKNAVSAAYLRLTPQLSLGTQKTGEEKLPFVVYNLSAGMDYIGYLQDLGAGSTSKDQHQIGATVGAGVMINPQGVLRFNLVEQFTRTNEPRAGVDFGYNRDYNALGFDLTWNPGKGFITLLLGYRFILDYFEDPYGDTAGNELGAYNAMRHDAKIKVTWRFFPKTAFWGEVDVGYNDYLREYNLSGLGTMGSGNRSSVPFRVMVGTTGQLTPYLVVDAAVGYRGFFYSDKLEGDVPNVNSVEDMHHDAYAHVSTTWQILTAARLRFGYQHDAYDSIVGDYYQGDSLFLSLLSEFFEKRLQLKVGFAWTLVNYEGLFYADTTGDNCTYVRDNPDGTPVSSCKRKDNYLIGDIGATWFFKNWISVGLGYQLLGNVSDFNTSYAGQPSQKPSFTKHRVFGLVQVYY